jgi:cytochrome c oxidase subunit 3
MTSHAEIDDDPHLAHHFESPAQQYQSARLGMWVFLVTEILFFGGLFCAYAVYRANHPEIFIFGHHFLDKNLGALNTVVLIFSSFTIAWAVRAAQLKQIRLLKLLLGLTLLCAFTFLGVKYVEYSHKWHAGLLWARSYAPQVHHGEGDHGAAPESVQMAVPAGGESAAVAGTAPAEPAPATAATPDHSNIAPAATGPAGLAVEAAGGGDEVVAEPKNAQTFFSIYFLMTGLHGIHVLGGIGAMFWLLFCARRGDFSTGHFTKVDMVALYWHLVDLIWIYLFLLLYLIH